jgi:hypothetical protein
MDKVKLKAKIKRTLLNFEDEEKEIEARKQRTKEALRKLQKAARSN